MPNFDPLSQGLTAITGAAAGVGGRLVWDRFVSERAIPLHNLVERSQLTAYGYRRLTAEAELILSNWRRILPRPPGECELPDWPAGDEAICVLAIDGHTACSHGSPDAPSTPLYVRLPGCHSVGEVVTGVQVELAKYLSASDLAKGLLQRYECPDEDRFRIWVTAPDLLITNASDAASALEEVARAARAAVRACRAVVEMPLAGDILVDLARTHAGRIVDSEHGHSCAGEAGSVPSPSPAILYARARTKAARFLHHGTVVGRLQLPSRWRVPLELVGLRLDASFPHDDRDPQVWSVLTVTGPPGSGKTELGDLLLENLAAEQNMIVLVLSGPTVLQQISALAGARREGLSRLIDSLVKDCLDQQSLR